jgi:hypothetical protein
LFLLVVGDGFEPSKAELTDFVMKILLGYAEYVMKQEEKPFSCDNCGLQGKTTSKVERAMRTINMRINVGKWSTSGALNATKIRLAYYYNGLDA